MKLRTTIARTITLALFALAAVIAQADSNGVYKYRSSVMKAIGGQMGSMGSSLKEDVFRENLRFHASAMADLADIVPTLFPQGSGAGKSETLPAVWEKPDEFKARVDDFVVAAKQLEKISSEGDLKAFISGMQKLGKTCKGCHDDFREEQKD
jgi:cytochrome c556